MISGIGQGGHEANGLMALLGLQHRPQQPDLAAFDTDADGQVSQTEFQDVLNANRDITNPDSVDRIFDRIDGDDNGFLTADEWTAFRERRDAMMQELSGRGRGVFMRAFENTSDEELKANIQNIFDADGNGEIDESELTHLQDSVERARTFVNSDQFAASRTPFRDLINTFLGEVEPGFETGA